jgi:hypothetical protein
LVKEEEEEEDGAMVYQDAVHVDDGMEPVGDHHHGAPATLATQSLLDGSVGLVVHARRGFVEDQHGAVA